MMINREYPKPHTATHGWVVVEKKNKAIRKGQLVMEVKYDGPLRELYATRDYMKPDFRHDSSYYVWERLNPLP